MLAAEQRGALAGRPFPCRLLAFEPSLFRWVQDAMLLELTVKVIKQLRSRWPLMIRPKPLTASRFASVFPSACSGSIGDRYRPQRQARHNRSYLFAFFPTPASVGVPISRRDAQRPYGLIQPHRICAKPRHLFRFIGIRDIAIPAFGSPKLSGAPGVTSGLEDILLLNGGVPCP